MVGHAFRGILFNLASIAHHIGAAYHKEENKGNGPEADAGIEGKTYDVLGDGDAEGIGEGGSEAYGRSYKDGTDGGHRVEAHLKNQG